MNGRSTESPRSVGIAGYTIASIDPSSPEIRDFAQLPHIRGLNSLAPPATDVMRQLGPDSLFYRHGETRLFACYKNKQLVGRVVASVDYDLPDQDVGHFGYFEVSPDKTCAGILMHASEEWLKEKGKKRVEGPVNLNMLAGYRLQTRSLKSLRTRTPSWQHRPDPRWAARPMGLSP